jgi:4-amino-4-deoxy-L-arabinose transferase-like glycosyltransferase
MAAALRMLGDSPRSIRLSAIAFSSLSAPLLLLFALEMSPFGVALASGFGCAVYPSWVFFSTSALTEPFFMPILIASLWFTAVAVRRGSYALAFLAGAVWGVAALVRPLAVPMAALVVGYFLWRKSLKSAILFGLGCTLVLSPWLIRNELVFGHPILANEGGETFLGSNNPYVLDNPADYGMWVAPWQVPEYRALMAPMKDELKENQLEYDLGKDFLRRYPGAIPKLVFYKLVRWLTPVTHTPGYIRYLVLGSYGALQLLLFIGVVRGSLQRSPALHLVLLWSLVLCGLTVVYWGNLVRGRLPLELVWIPWGVLAAHNLASAQRATSVVI